jgi:2-alkyl-3-oxoalkanoate reductase
VNIAGETLVLGTPGIDGVVLRYGFLYGEGTAIGPGGAWVTGSSRARCRLSARAPAGIRLFTSATQCRPPCKRSTGKPRHLQRRGRRARPQAEWLPYLAEILDAPPPRRVSEEEAEEQIGAQAVYYGTQLRAASNAKAKSELGLTLGIPVMAGGIPRAVRLIASRGGPRTRGRGGRTLVG